TMDLEDLISKFITGGAGKSTSSSSTESSASQPATDDAEPSFVE
ncbi:outer membrane lipid asymmetry maintenance protein MlaD, partial [Acinetobacter ursingii]